MLTKYAIIVAGGSGNRMKSTVPKQFLELAGKPILLHTLEKFQETADHIILVLPKESLQEFEQVKQKFQVNIRVTTVAGGESRFDSVKNGLSMIYEADGLVAVHDAVRPFVTEVIIERSFQMAEQKGSAVVSVSIKDSIRKIENGLSYSLDRSQYFLMQTPQTFRLPLLRKAYHKVSGLSFTDDASVFEADGHEVHMIEGTFQNIKITTPEDIFIGEAILKFQRSFNQII